MALTPSIQTLVSYINSPRDINITDNSDYAGEGIGNANASGLLKITSPAGVVFYNNTNWLNPDIDLDNPLKLLEKANIPLPLGGDGLPLLGNYKVDYQVRYSPVLRSYPIINVDLVNNKIKISGDLVVEALAAYNFNINGSTGNDGGYSVSDISLDGGNTSIKFVEQLLDATVDGNFRYEDDRAMGYTYTLSQIYNLCFELPVINLEVSHDCRRSQLLSEDVSDYDIDCNGTEVEPDSVTRTMTIEYPETMPVAMADVVTDSEEYYLGPRIWTGVYRISLSSVLQYTLPDDLVVQATILGNTTDEVECDECLCLYFPCMETLYENYYTYLGNNANKAETLKKVIDQLELNFMMYIAAEDCGEDSSVYCEKIADILSTQNCNCSPVTGDTSIEIIPVISSIGGGSGSGTCCDIFSVTSDPLSTLGKTGDWAFEDNGDCWKKVAGAWVLQFNIMGAAGATGATGATGAQGDPGACIIIQELFPSVNTGIGIEMLKSGNIPTVDIAQYDEIYIQAEFDIAENCDSSVYLQTSTGIHIGKKFNNIAGSLQHVRIDAILKVFSLTGPSNIKMTQLVFVHPTITGDVVSDVKPYGDLAEGITISLVPSNITIWAMCNDDVVSTTCNFLTATLYKKQV
uniref:Uncharacterized protein n=1 Tax=viral metagenome TaxID=1070528 RepID=A0A6M3KR34_9ZZZZ